MSTQKNQRRKPPRKVKTTVRRRSRAAGSRVGDDLVAAFEEMAAHLRGEIELKSYPVLDTNGRVTRKSAHTAIKSASRSRLSLLKPSSRS